MKINEVLCKSILTPSGLADYTINCYTGCQHGCLYCYARFMMKFRGYSGRWGDFVDVKINALDILRKDIKKRPRGSVFISSVCDGWQPLEEKYRLTRGCIEILIKEKFPLIILTKSALILRDLEILRDSNDVEIGVTITTTDESVRKDFEPHASSISERIRVIEEAKSSHLKTYMFIGPLLPGISDSSEEIAQLTGIVKKYDLDFFYVDLLNPHWQIWSSMKDVVEKKYPQSLNVIKSVLFNDRSRRSYAEMIRERVLRQCKQIGVSSRLRFCF